MVLNCIFARDKNGKMNTEEGKLPWRVEPFCSDPEIKDFSKKDMKHFKEVTSHNIVIMGYNTFLTFEKPLPERWNIVIDRNKIESEIFQIQTLSSGKTNFEKWEEMKENWIFFRSIEECIENLEMLEKSFGEENRKFPKVWLIGGKKIINYCSEKGFLNGTGIIDETVYPWEM